MAGKILNDNRLKQIFNSIKTNFFRKSEAQEVEAVSIDTTPTSGSDNLVTSGGVYNYVQAVVPTKEEIVQDVLDELPTWTIGGDY